MPDEDRSLGDFSDLLGLSAVTQANGTVPIGGLNLGMLDDGSIADSTDTSATNIAFAFCITFGGRPVGTMPFAAPTVQAVIQLVELVVAAANASERAQGRPDSWGATLGACPV